MTTRSRRPGRHPVNDALGRKPNKIKGASDDSRSVHGLTHQYVTGRAQRKLDARHSPPTSRQTTNPAGAGCNWRGSLVGNGKVTLYDLFV